MNEEIGVDIVSKERFNQNDPNFNSFLDKIFTKKERDYCFKSADKSLCFSGKYAAKEAVIKVLSDKNISIAHVKQIEILNDSNGKPFLNKCPIKNIKNRISLSISHDKDLAIAVAIQS
tara:strand:- start:104 stop:457 length:354 start_codon:yes stop_codon:yes gene_type:complete